MPQENGKPTFYNNARNQGRSIAVAIPSKIAEERNIEKGDKLMFQKENSQKIAERKDRKHGDYFTIWNETKQRTEKTQRYTEEEKHPMMVRKEGGSKMITIPVSITEKLEIKEGDKIAFELEYSEKIDNKQGRKHGEYISGWNETDQKKETTEEVENL